MTFRRFDRQRANQPIRKGTLNDPIAALENLLKLRVEAPLDLQWAGGVPMLRLSADFASTSSTYKRGFGTVASTISAASSKLAPGTYGGGTVKIDVISGGSYSAGGTITVKNRWPVSLAVDVLVEFSSDDNGVTWYIDNYYCP